jgi:hypothetical protein
LLVGRLFQLSAPAFSPHLSLFCARADTALFVWFRKFDASYAVGGKFYELIAESSRPAFAAATAARPLVNPSIFVLISMLATAFLAHYNAPKYYKELATPADGTSKQKAFNVVCAGAFGLASLLCAAVMAGGYLTFGGASQGLILNSYATSDPLALLARLGICASIIFSYPLNFVGLREGVLDLFKLDGKKVRRPPQGRRKAAARPPRPVLSTVCSSRAPLTAVPLIPARVCCLLPAACCLLPAACHCRAPVLGARGDDPGAALRHERRGPGPEESRARRRGGRRGARHVAGLHLPRAHVHPGDAAEAQGASGEGIGHLGLAPP